jgi:PleD family two-component response regulator
VKVIEEPISFSSGMHQIIDSNNLSRCIKICDELLYLAKGSGRDKIQLLKSG